MLECMHNSTQLRYIIMKTYQYEEEMVDLFTGS